jgi:hypothetical protein
MSKETQEQPRRAGNKTGSNKGIAKANRERKRAEAEARNALTPIERRRAFRRGLIVVDPAAAAKAQELS